MKKAKPFLISLICLLAGLAFAGFGSYNLYARFAFVPTDAVVMDVWYTETDAESADTTHALVSYSVDGVDYEEELQNFASKDAKVGKVISVRYNPNNPKEVHGDKNVLPYVQIAIGTLFAVVGAIMLVRAIKQTKKEAVEPTPASDTFYQ